MQRACCSIPGEEISCAMYVGIDGYGTEKAEDKERLGYIFLIREIQKVYRIPKVMGTQIQNLLEPGAFYRLWVCGGILWEAEREETCCGTLSGKERAGGSIRRCIDKKVPFIPPVKGIPGKRTLKNFLALAMEPVGTVLYVFGGGWNWQDTAAAQLAVKIGVAQQWRAFFEEQDEHYRYRDDGDLRNSYYPSRGYNAYGYAGLDCSGYIGWVVYNMLETKDDGQGYVIRAVDMAKTYAEKFHFGKWTREIPDSSVFVPGDIFSIDGHVWICLGRCRDGSLVILHSTPSDSICGCPGGGVQLSGLGSAPDCEGWKLADRYMRKYFPKWSCRYRAVQKPYDLYTDCCAEQTGKFSWTIGAGGIADPELYTEKNAEEILKDLFGE